MDHEGDRPVTIRDRVRCVVIPCFSQPYIASVKVFDPSREFLDEYDRLEDGGMELYKMLDSGDTTMRSSIMDVLCIDYGTGHYSEAKRKLLRKPSPQVYSRFQTEYYPKVSSCDGLLESAQIGLTRSGGVCHAFWLGAELGDMVGTNLFQTLPQNQTIPQVYGSVVITVSKLEKFRGCKYEIFESVPHAALDVLEELCEATAEVVQDKYHRAGLRV